MKSTKKEIFVLTLVGIVIFMIVIIIGTLSSKTIKQVIKITTQKKPTNTPTPTVPPITDLESKPGIKTYTNSKYNFSFQHLATTSLIQVKDTLTPEYVKILYNGPNQKLKTENASRLSDGYSIEISFLSSKQISIDDYVAQVREGSRVECSWTSHITPVIHTTIGRKPAQQFSILNCVGSSISTQYYIDNTDTVIQISTDIVGDATAKATYKKVIENIISSIIFL